VVNQRISTPQLISGERFFPIRLAAAETQIQAASLLYWCIKGHAPNGTPLRTCILQAPKDSPLRGGVYGIAESTIVTLRNRFVDVAGHPVRNAVISRGQCDFTKPDVYVRASTAAKEAGYTRVGIGGRFRKDAVVGGPQPPNAIRDSLNGEWFVRTRYVESLKAKADFDRITLE
jgi:hypothetical protein